LVSQEEDDEQAFNKWLADGAAAGWISLPVCITHTEFPTRSWEDFTLMAGADPCIFMLRLWKDGMEDADPDEMVEFWLSDETE
jgi:hypothetical protein